jgi:DHA1 family bicyclomycin/chloramphenicol resistance-like MFS transporter
MKGEFKYLFLIITIFIAACVETDIYLPAFPDMMAWYKASESAIQGLLTWNFVGICLSGPFYGPLSDAFGRKKPLLAALGLFLLGSFITLFSQDLFQMLLGRILQGIGSGGCFTLGTAIIFDAFQKERAIRACNNIFTIVPVIMAGAPLLGGYLNLMYGFRSNFLAIVILVLISFFISALFFKETLPTEKRIPLQLSSILRDFKLALTHIAFWQLTLVMSLVFAAYIAFLSGSAILFVVDFGMSKSIFPLIQGTILGGWVAGSLLLNRAIRTFGIPSVKRAGTALSIAGALTLALATLLTPTNPYLLTFPVVLFAFGANWIIGIYFPDCMELLPHIKGITSSLITSARLLIAAFVVALTSSCYNGTIYPLAAVVIVSILAVVPLLWHYEKTATVKVSSDSNFVGH